MTKKFEDIFIKAHTGEIPIIKDTYEDGFAGGVKAVLEILEEEAKRGTANASYLVRQIKERLGSWE